MFAKKLKRNLLPVLLVSTACSCTFYLIHRTFNIACDSFIYSHPTQNLSEVDYKKLMNLSNFHFNILHECSPDTSPFLLTFVHTSPTHFDRRRCIRETWGSNRKGLKVVFMLGSVDKQDWKLQKRLEQENGLHNDLIQGTFLDAYANITYKHIMSFKYAIYHCPNAKYILKTDDDVFVNMLDLLGFLTNKFSLYGAQNLLLCSVRRLVVNRNKNSKWYMPRQEYKSNTYPPFCAGSAMLYSPDVLFELYQEAQKSKYFRLDDVFVTGMLARNRKILHTDVTPFIMGNQNLKDIEKKGGFYSSDKKMFLYGPRNLSVQQMYLLWDFVKNKTIDKVVNRSRS